ncbi:hypothetical protein COOONC_22681, partial [Cooperia oncophora]
YIGVKLAEDKCSSFSAILRDSCALATFSEQRGILLQEFQQIVDSCEGLVVFSFGSVTPTHRMPAEWKKSFLEAFSRFPNLNFVLRYEGTDLKDQLPSNVYLFKWLPQADLLSHPKTLAFISHGGYNSLQEAVTAGVPLITVALFGDQPRNAKLAERHHFAINIRKERSQC